MRFYRFLKKRRTLINSILITIFTSLIFNAISDLQAGIGELSVKEFVKPDTLSGLLMIVSLVLLALFNIFFYIYEKVINHFELSNQFTKIMLEHTGKRIRDSVKIGCFSWGEDKTVEICDEILYGWASEDIKIRLYRNEQYEFLGLEDSKRKWGEKSYYFNAEDYKKYVDTEAFRKIIEEKNNMPRYMLCDIKTNINRHSKQLQLSVQRTEWSNCRYVWDKFKDRELLLEYAKGVASGGNMEATLPNSICLHLIVETADDKLVLARISKMKHNDAPGTWALTLGEQIEVEDFTAGNDFYSDFIYRWVRRAFLEEYRIDGDLYKDVVSEKNISILAVDFEGDIYNFSLVCFARINYTFDSFMELQKTRLYMAEATELAPLSYGEIPDILMGYYEDQKEYHPSSYLRMMLSYMHRYGIDKLQREIIDRSKGKKKEKQNGKNRKKRSLLVRKREKIQAVSSEF